MRFDLSTWLFRKRLEAKVVLDRGSVAAHRVGNPYHAVSIQGGQGCCSQARLMKDKRFLSSEAPTLPLDLCDAPACTCRYRHYEDRRQNSRRAEDQGLPPRDFPIGERRAGRGRRISDL